MGIVGQESSEADRLSERPRSELDAAGFTMVVLLVVIAIMAVGMSALLPTWRQQALREQEEELIFRGNQYARALVLYARKNNNQLPNNIDVLYEGKYLRKKYKDPITGEDFGLMPAGQPVGVAGRGGAAGTPSQGRGGRSGGNPPQSGLGAPSGTTIVTSIQGVYSTSTDTSIRVYQNQQRYIDWPFTVQTAQLLMGQAAGGRVGGPQQRFGGDGGIPPRGGGPGRGGGPETAPGRGGVQGGRGGDPGTPGRGGGPITVGRGGRGGR